MAAASYDLLFYDAVYKCTYINNNNNNNNNYNYNKVTIYKAQ